MLKDEDVVIFNPRRKNFDDYSQYAERKQIAWEHTHLKKADVISFWFSKESISPITLYELGTWSMSKKRILVGEEPGYPRIKDVKIQLRLVRPDVRVVDTLAALSEQIKGTLRSLRARRS
jgi:hypothetical protein